MDSIQFTRYIFRASEEGIGEDDGAVANTRRAQRVVILQVRKRAGGAQRRGRNRLAGRSQGFDEHYV